MLKHFDRYNSIKFFICIKIIHITSYNSYIINILCFAFARKASEEIKLRIEKEINVINDIKKSQKKKLAIIGGSKISTKINTLLSLTTSCSDIFIGGAMANNFLKYNNRI